MYALWILAFKHHGTPPGKGGLYAYFFCYSFLIAIDFILLSSMIVHLFEPIDNLKTIGIPFLLIYPGIAVLAPFFGAIGAVFGSAHMLRLQSGFNASCVLVNYPATVLMQLFCQDEPVYMCVVGMLWLNKMAISFYGAKVRQHLINPGFVKNQTKFKELADLQLTVGNRFPRSRILAATDEEEDDENMLPGGAGTAAEAEELEDITASDFKTSLLNRSNNPYEEKQE